MRNGLKTCQEKNKYATVSRVISSSYFFIKQLHMIPIGMPGNNVEFLFCHLDIFIIIILYYIILHIIYIIILFN
jgi:hypothetical protein